MDDNRRLPIVYVRGFAGGTRGIDKAVDDPFYGFNEGSTHVRVGARNQPLFHQFESPLLRLLREEGYELLVKGSQETYLAEHAEIPADTVWIHRFYDRSATTWGDSPQEYRLERAAADLLDLIDRLREKSGAPAVFLVAHSMGGLVCRCLLQKVLPDRGRDAADCVAKLFTYGTPHGGIAFDLGGGLFERVRDTFGLQGADIFGPRRMYEYLTPQARLDSEGRPPEGWDARRMPEGPGTLPVERVFCLVGTDPTDYDVAFGLSAAAVGPHSDGLVQIERAYVPGAHRAFVHRSHSGRYGMVNSEEGYQNLRRFLFGDTRIEASLVGHRLPDDGLVWQAEVRLSVRGLPVVMHERLAAHWCPIQLDPPSDGDPASVSLATTFLNSGLRTATDEPMRFILELRLISLRERRGILSLGDHLEQSADFSDTLVIDVGTPEAGPGIWASWNSEIEGAIRDHHVAGEPRVDEDPTPDRWVAHMHLPTTAAPLVGPAARIRLVATPWV